MIKKILTIEDFTIIKPPPYVRWEEVEEIMGKSRYKKFVKWMMGATCSMDGLYPWDLELYLEQINKGVKEPIVLD